MIKRREFITLLTGATAAWPLAAGVQQADRMRRLLTIPIVFVTVLAKRRAETYDCVETC
jgi:hypothetical protein